MRKAAINYLQGDFIAKLISVLVVLLVGKLLTKEDISTYTLIVYVIEMMVVFISFGSEAAILKFYREYSPEIIFNNILFQCVTNLIIVSGILYLAAIFYLEGVYSFILKDYFLIVISSFLVVLSNISKNHLISLNNSKKVKSFTILGSVLNILTITLFIIAGGLNYKGLVTARVVGLSTFLVFFIFIFFRLLDLSSIKKSVLKNLYHYTIPILISSIVGTTNLYLSRLILSSKITSYQLGIYSYFVMIIVSANFLFHSFNQAWTPYLFDILKNNSEEVGLKRINALYSKALLLITLYLGLSVVAFFISNLFDLDLKGFYKYRSLFFILADSFAFTSFYILINPLVYFKNNSKYVAYSSIITFVVNLALTLFLIELLGIFGAAISSVLITVFTYYLYDFFSNKSFNLKVITTKNSIYLYWIIFAFLFKYLVIYYFTEL